MAGGFFTTSATWEAFTSKKKSQEHLNSCRNAFDKIQHLFMLKVLIKVAVEKMGLSIMKTVMKNPE